MKNDVSSILTHKEYGSTKLRRRASANKKGDVDLVALFDYPKWLAVLFVFTFALSGLGEDKVLNGRFGGIPKAITVAVIAMAILSLIFKGDFRKFRWIGKTAAMYLLYWGALALWSAILWVINFSEMSAITRGIEKTLFQTIAILAAICAVYVFGEKCIDLFAVAIYAANGMIAIMEIPNYGGVGNAVQSVFDLIIHFGEGSGYALALEIHEITFLYGMFIVYYAVFAPCETREQKRKNLLHILASIFFILLGMKRLLVLAVPLIVFAARFARKLQKPFRAVIVVGVFWFVFLFLYLYGVANGTVRNLAAQYGIDMMGRDYIWGLVRKYYQFSPTYLGQGFGAVDGVIVPAMFYAGLVNKAYPLHNDILKVFIEFGFVGFTVWLLAQFIVFPILLRRFFDEDTSVLYMSILSLMTMTYLTDNTAFYFWCMLSLRLLPLAYGIYRKKMTPEDRREREKKWTPPTRDDFRQLVRETMIRSGSKQNDEGTVDEEEQHDSHSAFGQQYGQGRHRNDAHELLSPDRPHADPV